MNKKNKIIIATTKQYIESQSSTSNNRFVFAYTITITNAGTIPAKLLYRHWLITDSNGKVQEVKGTGVIGVQPYLKSGELFQYSSNAIIETPIGIMQGQYSMISDYNETFNAIIPQFTLSIPRTLH